MLDFKIISNTKNLLFRNHIDFSDLELRKSNN